MPRFVVKLVYPDNSKTTVFVDAADKADADKQAQALAKASGSTVKHVEAEIVYKMA